MLETGKTIIPVFYNVNPSQLRWTRSGDRVYARGLNSYWFTSFLVILMATIPWFIEHLSVLLIIFLSILLCILVTHLSTRDKNGVYARALRMLEKKTEVDSRTNRRKPRYESHTIEKWRNSLSAVSNITGFELNAFNGDEGLLVQKVVEQVFKKVGKTPLDVAKYPTGLNDKVEDFESTVLSQHQSEQSTAVGIVGLGGVGKSTLAKELFNRYRSKYDQSCFLSDVRENAAKGLLNVLQSTLLKDLGQPDVHISSTHEGIETLKRHLSGSRRVLVVIDDVDNMSQLDALFLPIKHTIPSSSLILVTSRDKDLLISSGIRECFIYKQTGLDPEHSRELFCSHAFNQPYPGMGFKQLVEGFLNACDGLPLSLKVIGALLYGKNLEYWEAQLDKISKILPSDILSSLKISYDSLDEEEQHIFLDIACFFIGEERDTAIRIWDGSQWQGSLGLRNLENKSLVEVDSKNRIRMHDHLRDLGRQIAKREIPHRLWRSDDIVSDHSPVRGISTHRAKSLDIPTNIRELQLLRAQGNSVKRILNVPQKPHLVWLHWNSCPYSSLPSWISLKNLRVLHIKGGEMETLWQNQSQAPLELRELKIDANLWNVPKSIGTLKHLEKFVLQGTGRWWMNLETLPDEVCGMHSLKLLKLEGCMKLKFLPDSAGNWKNIQCIDLAWCCTLQELPDSAGNWTNLRQINLSNCHSLRELPDSAGNWTNLRQINLSSCCSLRELPDSAGNWTNLTVINLNLCLALQGLPDSAGNWTNLKKIDLNKCSALQWLPDSAGNWTNLTEIDLSECSALQGLPDSAGNWTNLTVINLNLCLALQGLPDSAGNWTNLKKIDLNECSALQWLPDSAGNWTNLTEIHLSHCSALQGLPDSAGNWTNLKKIDLSECSALQGLPDSAGNWTNLTEIDLSECSALQGLPDSAGNWTNLTEIDLRECSALQGLPDSAGNWTNLTEIDLSECSALQGLPDSAGNWTNLKKIDLTECSALQGLPDSAGSWTNLDLTECSGLQGLPDSVGNWKNLAYMDFDSKRCSNLRWTGDVVELPRNEDEVELRRQRVQEVFDMKNNS